MNPRIEIRHLQERIDAIEKELIQVKETAENAKYVATAKGTSIPEPDKPGPPEWEARLGALEQGLKDLAAKVRDRPGEDLTVTMPPGTIVEEPRVIPEEPEEPQLEPAPRIEGPSDVYTHVMEDGRTYFLFKGRAPLPYFTRDMGAAIAKGAGKVAEVPEGYEVFINEAFKRPQLRRSR